MLTRPDPLAPTPTLYPLPFTQTLPHSRSTHVRCGVGSTVRTEMTCPPTRASSPRAVRRRLSRFDERPVLLPLRLYRTT